MSICNFGYFPFWFRGRDFGIDCTTSWSLLTVLLFCKEAKASRPLVSMSSKAGKSFIPLTYPHKNAAFFERPTFHLIFSYWSKVDNLRAKPLQF